MLTRILFAVLFLCSGVASADLPRPKAKAEEAVIRLDYLTSSITAWDVMFMLQGKLHNVIVVKDEIDYKQATGLQRNGYHPATGSEVRTLFGTICARLGYTRPTASCNKGVWLADTPPDTGYPHVMHKDGTIEEEGKALRAGFLLIADGE